MYGLLTKCEVKTAGYWPSSFFACLWTETESRSINTQKKNSANIKPSWPNKLGLNKGFIMWLLGNFFLRDKAGTVPSGQDGSILPATFGSQSQRRI